MYSNFDLFFSSHSHSNEIVKLFFNKLLTDYKFKVFLNDTENAGKTIANIIKEFIKNSKCILCFLSKKYLESEDCLNEIRYASSNKQQIFVIKLEDIQLAEDSIVPLATFNFYSPEDKENMFTCKSFNLLINSIQQLFKIKEFLLSDSSKSDIFLKNRPMSPLPLSNRPKLPEKEFNKNLIYDDGSDLSTYGKFMLLANGDCYNGKLLNKKYFGYGIYKWSNGETYEGDWLINLFYID